MLFLALLPAGCPDGDGDRCPESFKVGELCEPEGLVCPYPGATCDNAPECTCTNQLGGLYWECNKMPYCRCTCFCGKIAVNTCEALGCAAEPSDPCPAKAAAICAVICRDAGPPEAGPDLPPVDHGPADMRPDVPASDLLLPDLPSSDLPVPDQNAPVDLAAPDAPHDGGTSPTPETGPPQG